MIVLAIVNFALFISLLTMIALALTRIDVLERAVRRLRDHLWSVQTGIGPHKDDTRDPLYGYRVVDPLQAWDMAMLEAAWKEVDTEFPEPPE